jgi:transposase
MASWSRQRVRTLAEFAAALGAGQARRMVRVLGQAGWHTSREVVGPPGMAPVFLPAPSPELQPAERLWPLADEAVANRAFATIEEALAGRCRVLQAEERG